MSAAFTDCDVCGYAPCACDDEVCANCGELEGDCECWSYDGPEEHLGDRNEVAS